MAEMGDLQTELDAANAWDIDARLDQAMDALQCPPPETIVDVLSGGERRRVALCKLLLEQPDLLRRFRAEARFHLALVHYRQGELKAARAQLRTFTATPRDPLITWLMYLTECLELPLRPEAPSLR